MAQSCSCARAKTARGCSAPLLRTCSHVPTATSLRCLPRPSRLSWWRSVRRQRGTYGGSRSPMGQTAIASVLADMKRRWLSFPIPTRGSPHPNERPRFIELHKRSGGCVASHHPDTQALRARRLRHRPRCRNLRVPGTPPKERPGGSRRTTTPPEDLAPAGPREARSRADQGSPEEFTVLTPRTGKLREGTTESVANQPLRVPLREESGPPPPYLVPQAVFRLAGIFAWALGFWIIEPISERCARGTVAVVGLGRSGSCLHGSDTPRAYHSVYPSDWTVALDRRQPE